MYRVSGRQRAAKEFQHLVDVRLRDRDIAKLVSTIAVSFTRRRVNAS